MYTDTDWQAKKLKKVKKLPVRARGSKQIAFYGVLEALSPLSES
jgi:hypothetical protein